MFKFHKTSRILKKSEYKEVLEHGEKVVSKQLVVFGKKTARQGLRLGLIVSRKVGGAVIRNKTKRRLREAFRHLKPDFSEQASIDLVIIARHSAGKVSYHELLQELRKNIEKLARRTC
ncbi:MAG: ribonuclease P protein component [Bdellovibrionota bacterium]